MSMLTRPVIRDSHTAARGPIGALAALVALLMALPLIATAGVASAQPAPPVFSCEDPHGYLFHGTTTTNSAVTRVNLATGDNVVVAPTFYALGTNAWGYNRTDNYFWGRENGDGGAILRTGSDWAPDVMMVPGINSVPATHNGDVDANGVLHLYGGGPEIYRIDANPASADYLTRLPTLTLSRATSNADFAFSAVDAQLYAVEGNLNVVRVNPANGQVTDLGTMTGPGTGGFGASFMDVDGNLYLSHNATGQIWVIEQVHTGNIAGELLSTGPTSTSNDGARCATAPSVLEPALAVTKTSDFVGAEIAAGDEINYTVTVVNGGNVTISGVDVEDPRVDLDCTPVVPANVAPGGEIVCTGTYTVSETDVLRGSVENTATARGTDPDGNTITGEGSTTVPAEAPAPALSVVKGSDFDADDLAAGDVITYTIVVENSGNVTISGVEVDDPLLTAVTCTPITPRTLAPGQQVVCEGTYTVTQDDVDDGEIVNTATATGTDPGGDPIEAEGSTTTPGPPPAPELTVVKTSDFEGAELTVGDLITYTIVAENTGNVTITDVVLDDPLLADLDCSEATPRALVPGQQLVCEGSYTVTQGDVDDGEIVNTATASGTDPGGDPVEGDGSTTVPGPAPVSELTVVKTTDFDESTLAEGDVITYTVTVDNTGNVTILDVVVVDPLIDDLACTPATPRALVPGAQLTCEGSYTVTADDVDTGEVVNTATAIGTGPDGGPVIGEGSNTVPDGVEVTRLGGESRIETAIVISQDSFSDEEAAVVILARDDIYADALSGTPLAVAEFGPILLTRTDELLPEVADEIRRVLADNGRIYLLGGEVALNADVWDQTMALGYPQERLFGVTRIETAIAIAGELGDPELLLLATGWEFADALTAAAAAGANGGAILLTPADVPHPSVDAYLDGRTSDLHAVGGPAARAYPDAQPVVGATRDDTAVQVAETFFDQPRAIGFARLDDFPDALTGGRHIAHREGPLLLTATDQVPDPTRDYACSLTALDQAYVYGGEVAVSAGTFDDISALVINGEGCPQA